MTALKHVEPARLEHYLPLIELARREDLGSGDITSELTIPAGRQGRARIVFREAGVLCGLGVVEQVLEIYDRQLHLDRRGGEGDRMASGTAVGAVSGPLRSLLAAERVLLNFLQRLSGVATLTAAYVEAVAGTGAVVCDTRKTTPGWRELEKYAVRCGGGLNHRQGLFDAVLIKDNHLAALGADDWIGGLEQALAQVRRSGRACQFVQVEVDTLGQLVQVLNVAGVDMVLLDNMSAEDMRQAVRLRDQAGLRGRVLLEASGRVTLAQVRAVAETGVDRISVGALTHSARNLDVALDME